MGVQEMAGEQERAGAAGANREAVRSPAPRSGGDAPLPLAPQPNPLPVIFHRNNDEEQQGDSLDACQQEEIVMQGAVVDVA